MLSCLSCLLFLFACLFGLPFTCLNNYLIRLFSSLLATLFNCQSMAYYFDFLLITSCLPIRLFYFLFFPSYSYFLHFESCISYFFLSLVFIMGDGWRRGACIWVLVSSLLQSCLIDLQVLCSSFNPSLLSLLLIVGMDGDEGHVFESWYFPCYNLVSSIYKSVLVLIRLLSFLLVYHDVSSLCVSSISDSMLSLFIAMLLFLVSLTSLHFFTPLFPSCS